MPEDSRRHYSFWVSVAVIVTFTLGAGTATAAKDWKSRPNILVILTDDQRYDTLSCTGHPYLRTPNLDALAGNGICFSNAFVTLSLCSPARASCLTGQYAHVHGVIGNRRWEVPYESPYIPPLLQKAGYVTACIGKWHMHRDLSDHRRPGFDHWAVFDNQGSYNDVTLNINGDRVPQSGHTTDVLTDQLIEFLNQDRRGKPFFAWLGTKAAHGDYIPAKRFQSLFDNVQMPIPPLGPEDQEGKPLFIRELARQERNPDVPFAPLARHEIFQQKVKGYLGTIAGVDENVGRIVTYLTECGDLENTVIIFLSDGGHYLGEHGLWDKRSCYDESLRIPFIIHDGRKPMAEGLQCSELVLNIDLAPTILDLAGANIPNSMQGRSLVPLLRGEGQADWRNEFLFQYFNVASNQRRMQADIQGIRTQRWKYIRSSDKEVPEELYDLQRDGSENRNLARDPAYADVLRRLRQRLVHLQAAVEMPVTSRLLPGE